MSTLVRNLQSACRAMLRPPARVLRTILTPPAEPTVFSWHRIQHGPATGVELLLPDGAAITEAMTTGRYEQAVTRFLEQLVKAGDHCWDVGGHYGYYTATMAKLSGSGQVHTFEPVPEHADRISQAAKRSGLAHVTVHQQAVAGTSGQMDLCFSPAGTGDDSMGYLDAYGGVDTPAAKEHYQHFQRTTVSTTTLDELAAQLPPVRLIKIDAEGAEAAIVGSGRNLISQWQPRLLVECHGIYEAMRCAEMLQAIDYRAIFLTDQKTTLPILWTHASDQQSVDIVRSVLGTDPVVLFDPPSRP